jgi:DNA replication protein DnaC
MKTPGGRKTTVNKSEPIKEDTMNEQHTLEKMKSMKMNAMAELYYQSTTQNSFTDMDVDSFMAMMVDREWDSRQSRKIEGLIKSAGFRINASPMNIDYSNQRMLDKAYINRLLGLGFLKKAENIILTGPTGVGKSYLAQTFGHQACQMLSKVRYYITARLFEQAKLARLEGTYHKLLKAYQNTQLLILDDFGLHSMDTFDRQTLLDIIEERHQKCATIFCSQIPVSKWHQLIGEGTIADAILDRVVYSSHRIELKGESLRKNKTLD